MPRHEPLHIVKNRRRAFLARLRAGQPVELSEAERELVHVRRLRQAYHAAILREAAYEACYLPRERLTKITVTITDRAVALARDDVELAEKIACRLVSAQQGIIRG